MVPQPVARLTPPLDDAGPPEGESEPSASGAEMEAEANHVGDSGNEEISASDQEVLRDGGDDDYDEELEGADDASGIALDDGSGDAGKAEPPSGPYQTLRMAGPQASEGSDGHPEECTPCTFYCFARRGCSRGLLCKFCHLSHQSKLRLRREAWKEQQREKRRSARELAAAKAVEVRRHNQDLRSGARPAVEAGGHMFADHARDLSNKCLKSASDCVAPSEEIKPIALFDLLSNEVRSQADGQRAHTGASADGKGVFAYSPSRATLAIGQEKEFRPTVEGPVRRFSPAAPLPADFRLDRATGVIIATPATPQPTMTLVIEAELHDGRTLRGMLQLEVVDFSLGGYVVGHMSEVAPGRFMMLLYVPEEGEPEEQQVASAGPMGGEQSEAVCTVPMAPQLMAQQHHQQQQQQRPAGEVAQPLLCAPRQNHQIPGKNPPGPVVNAAPSLVDTKARDARSDNDPNGLIGMLADGDSSLLQIEDVLDSALLGSSLAPTVGSLAHRHGRCKPCAFVFKDDGCQSGVQCKFCHLCDQGEKRRRMKERKEVRKSGGAEQWRHAMETGKA